MKAEISFYPQHAVQIEFIPESEEEKKLLQELAKTAPFVSGRNPNHHAQRAGFHFGSRTIEEPYNFVVFESENSTKEDWHRR